MNTVRNLKNTEYQERLKKEINERVTTLIQTLKFIFRMPLSLSLKIYKIVALEF